ncbi:hypothetical protein HDV00_002319 [Rhizophlyctis rosea]|nr:hypothetical protein HDV00_002319 [Rhizophlyctis rosea]
MPPMSTECPLGDEASLNPLACSPETLIDLLHERYLHTLVIDVRTRRDVNLPGARHYEFIQELLRGGSPTAELNPPLSLAHKTLSVSSIKGGLEFTVPAPETPVLNPTGTPVSLTDTDLLNTQWETVDDPSFNRRSETDIIVCDDYGEPNGPAFKVASVLAMEGKALSARYLHGGMASFAQLYPSLVHLRNNGSAYPSPTSPDSPTPGGILTDTPTTIESQSFSPLLPALSTPSIGPYLTPTVQDLSTRQSRLVTAVWYQGRGDIPLPIIPNFLYLGSCFAARSPAMVELNIQHVVRLGWGFGEHGGGAGVKVHDYPLEDSPEERIGEWFEEVCGVICEAEERGERVLVHCHAGVSRSATIVLAYLMKYRGMRLFEAWNVAYRSRPIIRPNAGFAHALQSLEKSLFQLQTSTMPVYWMSDSYVNYLSYLEWMGRVERWKGVGKGWGEVSAGKGGEEGDGCKEE